MIEVEKYNKKKTRKDIFIVLFAWTSRSTRRSHFYSHIQIIVWEGKLGEKYMRYVSGGHSTPQLPAISWQFFTLLTQFLGSLSLQSMWKMGETN